MPASCSRAGSSSVGEQPSADAAPDPGRGAASDPAAAPRLVHRRTVVRVLATAGVLAPALAGCGPVAVSAVGGPVGQPAAPAPTRGAVHGAAAESPLPSPAASTTTASSTPSATTASAPATTDSGPPATAAPLETSSPSSTASPASPTAVASVPPLQPDVLVLDGAPLLVDVPSSTGWRKTVTPTAAGDVRTRYDEESQSLHLIVELVAALGISPIAHARRLATARRAADPGYRQRQLVERPDGSAVWAFDSVDPAGNPVSAFDWFAAFPAFEAAVYLGGPAASRDTVRALWQAVVDSVRLPTPVATPTSALQRLVASAGATASATG